MSESLKSLAKARPLLLLEFDWFPEFDDSTLLLARVCAKAARFWRISELLLDVWRSTAGLAGESLCWGCENDLVRWCGESERSTREVLEEDTRPKLDTVVTPLTV